MRAYDGQLRKGQDADPCVVLLCVSCTTSVICCVCVTVRAVSAVMVTSVFDGLGCAFWAGFGVCQRDAGADGRREMVCLSYGLSGRLRGAASVPPVQDGIDASPNEVFIRVGAKHFPTTRPMLSTVLLSLTAAPPSHPIF